MSIIHDALKKAEKDRQSETDKGSVSSLPTFLKKKSSFFENKRKLIAISFSVLVFIAVIFFIFSGSKKEKSQDTTISQKIDRENLPQTSVNVEEGKIEKDSSESSPKIENIMEDLGKKIIQQRKNPESPIETKKLPVEKTDYKSKSVIKVEKPMTKETPIVYAADENELLNLRESREINQKQEETVLLKKHEEPNSEIKQTGEIPEPKVEEPIMIEKQNEELAAEKQEEKVTEESDYEKKNEEPLSIPIDEETSDESLTVSTTEEQSSMQETEVSNEPAYSTPVEEENIQAEEQNESNMTPETVETLAEPEPTLESSEEIKPDESEILPSDQNEEEQSLTNSDSKPDSQENGLGVVQYNIQEQPSESEESRMLIEKLPKKEEPKVTSAIIDKKPTITPTQKIETSPVINQAEEPPSIQNAESLKSYYEKALSLEKEGNLEKAMNYYKKVIAFDPKNSKAHNSLGNIYLKLKNTEMAKREFQMILMLDPLDSAARNNLGLVYLGQNEYIKALGEFNKAVNASPTNVAAYNNLGITYKKLKKYNDALEQFNKALFINKNYAQAYYSRATVLESIGRIQESIMDYRKFIELAPENLKDEVRKVQDHIMDLYESSSNY